MCDRGSLPVCNSVPTSIVTVVQSLPVCHMYCLRLSNSPTTNYVCTLWCIPQVHSGTFHGEYSIFHSRRDKLWIAMEFCGGGSLKDIYQSGCGCVDVSLYHRSVSYTT